MEVFQKNVYLLSKEESKTLTLSEIAELRKGKQYQSRVKFFQDMKDDDVRNLLENKFSPILSNKRFSCATRDGQTSARLNFHGEHRVWDGRTIKRKVQGGSALYLVLEDEPVFNSVSPARGTPSSLQGHLSSTSFYHNSKNGQTVSWTQTPQSATTVTSLKTTNSTENAVETTQWERDMNTNNPGWLGDNLNAPNSPDISIENLTAAGAVETLSEASLLTNGNQEQNELMEKDCLISDKSDSSGQSDSGISSEASACPAQALNRPISPRRQDARMKPAEGPLQGGGLFRAVVDEELPRSMETGWAKFGDKPVKVWVSRDGLCLFGEEIPRGDVPGPVTVTFSSLNGECVAKATYTYQERKNSTTPQIKRALDEIEECVKRLRSESDLCDESEELASDNSHESGGDAPGPVTVTFATLNGECMAKTTSTDKKCENPMTWQITHFKRALNGVEECVKRLRNVADSCYESNKFAEENHHDSGVTQVVKAQLGEEGYFGDTEKSDTESEDSYRMDNNENEIEEGDFNDPRTSVVTELQLSEISDDVGTCWRELGPKLDIPAAKIQNLDEDYRCTRDKANILLLMWQQKEGSSALAGRLADALVSIGKKGIAEKLLGMDDARMLSCGNISKGHVLSLTVIRDLSEGLDKLIVCEDAQGNKFMVKTLNSSDTLSKLEEKLVARQESLKSYISSELEDLRLQMKKVEKACGNVDKKDKTEPTSSLFSEEVDLPNDESVEKLLQSCEEHRIFFQKMFDSHIKLTSVLELAGTRSQLKKQHKNRVKELQKWKKQYELQFKEVKKLLSSRLLHQRTTERKPSYKGRLPSHQETVLKRRSKFLPGYGRKSSRRNSEGDLTGNTRTKPSHEETVPKRRSKFLPGYGRKSSRRNSEGDLTGKTRTKSSHQETVPKRRSKFLPGYGRKSSHQETVPKRRSKFLPGYGRKSSQQETVPKRRSKFLPGYGRRSSHQETVPKRRSKFLPGYGRKSSRHYSEGDLPGETRTKPSHEETVPKRRSKFLPGYGRKSSRPYSEGDLPGETRTKTIFSQLASSYQS